ncbi:hypothetical protein JXB02_02675 [Candidatus Woesearchaeota archaeon]|nr:hypothetical protein [Candidatus Woesearchaeota archaeon]
MAARTAFCTGFPRLARELAAFDEKREAIILASREALKSSKTAIYAVHRGEDAKSLLAAAAERMRAMAAMIAKDARLGTVGAYSQAAQEYVEAAAFRSFMRDRTIPDAKDLAPAPTVPLAAEDYLAGLCDLTGELARKAVNAAIRKDRMLVGDIRDAIDEISYRMAQLNLRNSDLRKKYDAVKWNLKKVEEVLYDLSR